MPAKAPAKAIAPAVEQPKPLLRVFVAGTPVSENSMYTAGRGQNHYAGRRLTNAAQAWRGLVKAEVLRATVRWKRGYVDTLRLPLRMTFTFYRLRANADPPNFNKLTADGIAMALGINDKNFYPVTADAFRPTRAKAKTYPFGCCIEIWEADA